MQREDLEVLIRSRVPLIVVESRDEAQVLKALTRSCTRQPTTTGMSPVKTTARTGLPLFQWSVTDGLKRLDVDVGPPQRSLTEPADILKHIRATNVGGVYALLDFHPYLKDPTLVRFLKDIAQEYNRCGRTIALISY